MNFHSEAVNPEGRELVRGFCTVNTVLKRSKRSLRVLDEARRFTVDTRFGSIVGYDWEPKAKEKPIVLLCHGWSDSSATWIAFNRPLREAGFRLVAFDQPAHAATSEHTGSTETIFTRMYEATVAMMNWAVEQGSVQAVIGHSVGALGAFLTACDTPPERLVCIAMPPGVPWFIEHYIDSLQIDETLKKELWMHLHRRFHDDMGADYNYEDMDSEKRAACLSIPVLFVQDDADLDVPIEATHRTLVAMASAGGSPECLDTSGLGHQLLLRAPVVLERVLAFIR